MCATLADCIDQVTRLFNCQPPWLYNRPNPVRVMESLWLLIARGRNTKQHEIDSTPLFSLILMLKCAHEDPPAYTIRMLSSSVYLSKTEIKQFESQ